MVYDLVLRRAQLRQHRDTVDIGITDGRIVAIAPRIEAPARDEIDAAGRLVTEPFVDCHFHVDKAFTGVTMGRFRYPLRSLPEIDAAFAAEARAGDTGGAVPYHGPHPLDLHRVLKRRYTIENVAERVGKALELALVHGTLAMRVFVDVDPIQRLTALRAVLGARERVADRMSVQVCAFPQDGLLDSPEMATLMEEAMHLGADVVGGIPWVEPDDTAAQAHIDWCFSLARRFDRGVHMLCDDTPDPNSRTLEMVAARTIRDGYQGRVAASHNGALRLYPDEHAAKVIDLVRQAEMHIVVIPSLNLLGTLTRVEEMLAAGINVCCGQDDLDNFFYPLGRANMLDAMHLIVHIAHLATPQGFETAYDIVTRQGARALGLERYAIEAGADANLLIFEGKTLHEVLQMQADRAYVIARGRVVATTTRLWQVAPLTQA